MSKSNVTDYHKEICQHLDSTYGKGFAEKNPQLVGHLVMAAAIDEAGLQIASKIEGLNDSLRTDHPLMAETFDGISNAVQSVADALNKSPAD
jgi:hypothetical protein